MCLAPGGHVDRQTDRLTDRKAYLIVIGIQTDGFFTLERYKNLQTRPTDR